LGKESDLLRMLEPAIRPVMTPAGSSQNVTRRLPFEQNDFESLLDDALINQQTQQVNGHVVQETGQSAGGREPGMLLPLGQLDQIENASLRNLIESHYSLAGRQTDLRILDDQDRDMKV